MSLWRYGVVYELRQKYPTIDLSLFKIRSFATANFAAFLNAIAFACGPYLQLILVYSALKAGLLLIPMEIIIFLIGPISGRLSDKYESRVLSSVGLALNASTLIWFSTSNQKSTYGAVLISLLLFGFGMALFYPPNARMGSVPPEKHGVENGIRMTLNQTGNVISVPFSLLDDKVSKQDVSKGLREMLQLEIRKEKEMKPELGKGDGIEVELLSEIELRKYVQGLPKRSPYTYNYYKVLASHKGKVSKHELLESLQKLQDKEVAGNVLAGIFGGIKKNWDKEMKSKERLDEEPSGKQEFSNKRSHDEIATPNMLKVAIVIPCFNTQETIANVVSKCSKYIGLDPDKPRNPAKSVTMR